MAWIGGVVAAAACANDGKRRRKPNKILLLFIIFSLLLGTFVPLVMILGMKSYESYSLLPILLMLVIIVGILISAAFGFSESLDKDEEPEIRPDTHSRYSRYPYETEQRQRRVSYQKNKLNEDYYWETEQKSAKMYCTNCGSRLGADDLFCYSCGWRVK